MAKDISPKVRQLVHQRDGKLCRLCEIRPATHIHHIKPRSERPDLINEPNNLISLCYSCHYLVHSNRKYFTPYLEEITK